MRTKLLFLATLAGVLPWTRGAAQSGSTDSLTIDVYTADSTGFGVTSTIIAGPTELILVDAQFLQSDAQRLADRIAATGKHLKAIIVTHAHPDHYFGLATLRKRFRSVPIYMSPAALEEFKRTVSEKIATWSAIYGPEIPTDVPTPLPLPSRRFTVDGHAVEVVSNLQGDANTPTNSYVWVPSLSAQVEGDLVYDQVHVWLAESDSTTRAAWRETLRRLGAQKPKTAVAGHKRSADLPNSPDAVAFTARYIADFETARATAQNAEELIAAMKQKYPDLGLELILTYAARAAFPAPAPTP
jgi:glyoxylase-like metal-dependent hydrolase (beta-lactamase superfamily II)